MSGETTRRGGIDFEYKVVAALVGDGYVTMRSAGSKGAIDVMALKPGQQLLVGCKRGGVCSAAEWDRLVELASWVGAVPVLAVNGPAGRGVDYWRLTGRRVRRAPMGRQPAERFLTDEVAAADAPHCLDLHPCPSCWCSTGQGEFVAPAGAGGTAIGNGGEA